MHAPRIILIRVNFNIPVNYLNTIPNIFHLKFRKSSHSYPTRFSHLIYAKLIHKLEAYVHFFFFFFTFWYFRLRLYFFPVGHCFKGWSKINLKVCDLIDYVNKNLITHFVLYLEKEKRYGIETLSIDRLLNKEHFIEKITQKICTKS